MTLTTTINNGTYTTTIQGPTSLLVLWEALYDTPRPAGQNNFFIHGDPGYSKTRNK